MRLPSSLTPRLGARLGNWSRLLHRLETPTDVASLAAFRVLFGLMMAGSALRFLARGWVKDFLAAPPFHFTYDGFSWVRPLPLPALELLFVGLALLGIAIACGFHYRAATFLFGLGFTYTELIDKATYLNHYYLISLLAGMMIFLPLGRVCSWDAWRNPERRIDAVPFWMLGALRLQVAIVYLFAGLTKIDGDWLLRAQPMRIWLHARSDLPLVGAVLEWTWVSYLAAWLGAAFDLSIVFFLLARRTRRWAYGAVVTFHGLTAILFPVGIFPWLMIACSSLFLAPDWPRAWRRGSTGAGPEAAARLTQVRLPSPRRLTALFALHLAVQVALPCRQYLDGEQSSWTSRGFNFAWNVMIAEKTGAVTFVVYPHQGGAPVLVKPEHYLTPRQTSQMAQDPSMIRAFGRHLAESHRRRGEPPPRVHAEAFAALNGRPHQRLIDPTVDLGRSD